MKTYTVHIVEKVSVPIEIAAENEADAIRKAKQAYVDSVWVEMQNKAPELDFEIENAKREPVRLGRPRTTSEDIPNIFHKYLPLYEKQEINLSNFAKLCGLTRPTIYKYLRLLGKKTVSEQETDLE